MTENIVTGKKYRILTNATSDIWDRISFWTRASDVAFNDNSTLEASKGTLGHTMLKRSTAYIVGNIAYTDSAPSWVMLRCTTAGTTAASAPSTYGTISSVGTVITDGTAKFTVYDARPNSTLSSSAYQIPTMSLVNNLNSELTANGKQFYFDYKNGKYGYNTSSNRAASTFVPFGGSGTATELIVLQNFYSQNLNDTTFTLTKTYSSLILVLSCYTSTDWSACTWTAPSGWTLLGQGSYPVDGTKGPGAIVMTKNTETSIGTLTFSGGGCGTGDNPYKLALIGVPK